MIQRGSVYSITEYGFLSKKQGNFESGSTCIDEDTFDQLENFILDERNGVYQFFTISKKPGLGKIIKANNYVGVIQTNNGSQIEILPKISGLDTSIESSKKILFKMLKTLKDSPFKSLDSTQLDTKKFPVLEIFIQLFLNEVDLLIKRGIKKNYVQTQENIRSIRGKLMIQQNIRYNYSQQERLFCQFDEFTDNIIENNLIKTCLEYVQHRSRLHSNKARIKQCLSVFSDIEKSYNHKSDLTRIGKNNRLMRYYDKTMKRVEIFLSSKSVVNFSGSTTATALLYPMEKIFESYVAHQLIKKYPHYSFHTQHQKHHLIEDHNGSKIFALRPDIVINDKIIIDTKRKKLDEINRKDKYNISQQDMYQLYGYAKKYNSTKLYLIYPQSVTFTKPLDFIYENGIHLTAIPYDIVNDYCPIFE